MDSQTDKKITWSLLELTGLLEEEDAHVHFERTTKHLALHPYHLTNIRRGLNQILKSSLNNYDKELNGFVLTFKNPKLLSNVGELLYDSPFIHVDVEADFYLFRPTVGSFLKGIVNKKGLDHIVMLVHKIYTISIPKPDNVEEWIGDSVEIGQEIRCCVNKIDNKSKPPFICATLNSDYLQGCRLSESINNIDTMEKSIESHNLDSSIIKTEKINGEISQEDTISDKERKKHRKKHKKSREIDIENIKYEDSNMDSTIERHKVNSIVKIDDSINEDDTITSDKEKKKHRKKHKKSYKTEESESFKNQTKSEFSNNTGNDIYRYIKCEVNDNVDDITESQNLNSTIKIDASTDKKILENDTISEKEKRKHRKKHKRSLESDLESISENKIETRLNNDIDSNIHKNIKCEDNKNSAVENHNVNRVIKIENSTSSISEDATSDREKTKHRKKRKRSHETDTENEVIFDNLGSSKKRKRTSTLSDSDSKTYIKIKAEKLDSDLELKSPIKIKSPVKVKVEKV